MSTRALIRIASHADALWFYRHNDGTPEEVLPDLAQVCGFVAQKLVPADVEHIANWFILSGMQRKLQEGLVHINPTRMAPLVGDYCPALGWKEHGDIGYFFDVILDNTPTVALFAKTIGGWKYLGTYTSVFELLTPTSVIPSIPVLYHFDFANSFFSPVMPGGELCDAPIKRSAQVNFEPFIVYYKAIDLPRESGQPQT
jgi:hypothetical protein